MIVAGRRDRDPQQVLIFIHRPDDRAEKQQKLRVVMRCFSRRYQVHALICRQRPVVVLAAAIYTIERFLVKQRDEAVALGHLFDHLHHQLVLIGCNIDLRINTGELML